MWRKSLAVICCFLLYSVYAQGASEAQDTSAAQNTSETEDTSATQDTSETEDTSATQNTSETEGTSATQDTSETEGTSVAQTTSQTELSSDGRLRYYGAEQEDFFVSPNYASFVRATEGQLVQKKYDTRYRLIKKITWVDNGTLLDSISDYTYEGDGLFPVSSQTHEITSARFISESYNTFGFVIRRERYLIPKADTSNLDKQNSDTVDLDDSSLADSIESPSFPVIETSVESEKILVFTQSWEYDADNRVIVELIEYADDAVQSKKTEYFFIRGKDKADVFYYTGDTLYKNTVYSSPDDWEEKVYFPGEIEIITTYREGTAVSEQFYQNGTKIRERKR